MESFPDFAQLSNVAFLEELYAKFRADPKSIDPSWRYFFEGLEFTGQSPASDAIRLYRTYGHLAVKLNPLTDQAPSTDLPKDAPAWLPAVYCSRIGFEYMHIENLEIQEWFQKRLEPELKIELSPEEKKLTLEMLGKSEVFETYINSKYPGQKRFSIEGGETLIPCLSELIEVGAQMGTTDFVIGMAHRGRLNVLANILNKPFSVIFQEFEDIILPMTFEGSGDVKYHKGYTSKGKTRSGKEVHLELAANSSALEAVDGVVLGQTRAKWDQDKPSCAILIHGDAALAGQGVVYESLQLMGLLGYTTNGSIHLVVNNQIGFTTLPEEGRSTRYCTDIAKAFGCPVFHVNAEDPESCIFATRMAIEFRQTFKRDVFIDLNCYRKYGHNEGDEPAFTQPEETKVIRTKKPIRDLYFEQLEKEGFVQAKADEEFHAVLNTALERGKLVEPHAPEERYGEYHAQPSIETLFETFDSSIGIPELKAVTDVITTVPEGFHIHPKLGKIVQERKETINGKIDWSMAEALAFGTLLVEGVPVRLSGQDTRRGTFSQRHAVWVDAENSTLFFPLAKLGHFEVENSPLSEYACLAFEYGYSWSYREALVLWEAQFGDFDIGAQTVIDHYITTAEQKWSRLSSIVLLLPHGYEGQGPEHSSGRIERFLQLAANHNIQIANATTPAQYFHLLRRQALREIKKPLILFTPKSLLRHPACVSTLAELSSGSFQEIIDDTMQKPKVVLLCSGKVYYDLIAKRTRKDVAIVRIEQLYPMHQKKLDEIFNKYKGAEFRWVQEEPENMGAWEFVRAYLPEKTSYVGRPRSAVTATGSLRQHKQEFDQFCNEAFK
jgi:2-oxoglutarate dehydrogenase E1 component